MQLRWIARIFTGFLLALFAGQNLLTASEPPVSLPASQTQRRPNIIYLMLDDAGWGDFGIQGSEYVKTPVFDRIAAEGMRFTQHYSGSAVCAPTRCVLMTGLHTGHARRRDNTAKAKMASLSKKNGRPLVFLQPEDITVATVLQQAGYATGGIGKWGLGNPGSEGVPEIHGFDYWYGYLDHVHAHKHFPDQIWEAGKMVDIPENRGRKQTTYIPYEQEKRALRFIREHQSEPFFLYLAVTPPHGKYIIPSDDPAYAMYEGIPGGDQVRHYAAMITRTDQMAGKILDLLQELELDQDTIVFYTSDNGPNPTFAKAIGSSGGLRGTKRFLYEGGIRAAMSVRWPSKVPAGVTSDFIWDMRDVFPTLCDIAQTDPPENLDGISVLPTLLGKQQVGREMHYWEIHSPFQQAARWGDWKAIRYGTQEPLEVYNLANDSAESTDISEANPEIVQKLTEFLDSSRIESEYFPAIAKRGRRKN